MQEDSPQEKPLGPAWLEGRALSFSDAEQQHEDSVVIPDGNVYLLGTGRLIDAMVYPAECLSSGEFLFRGRPFAEALRGGEVGVCPSRLPVPETTRLLDALVASARLLGQSTSHVRRALEQVGLVAREKSTLKGMTPEEHRRAGIAHGLLTQPRLLVFARPFSGLTDRARRDLSRMMERVTQQRAWILSGEPGCSVSQSWMKEAHWVVGTNDAGRIEAQATPAPGCNAYFLRITKTPAGLAAKLKDLGASVAHGENPHFLFVGGLNEEEIVGVCKRFSDCTIVSIQPAEERGFRSNHARSAL